MLRARDSGRVYADHRETPSRRALFAGSTAALVAGAAIATNAARAAVASPQAAGGDAELIRLVGQARAGQQVLDYVESRVELDGEEVYRLNDRALKLFWGAADKIVITRPSTAAGLQAKASVMLMILQQTAASGIDDTLDDIASGDVGEYEHRFALALARDVLAWRATA